ncbi:MAG: hypothetical protein KJO98_14130 [Rhodothermia bacterium]|nr:hypothetical protein [Rhodothermia bacterium]
MSTLVTRSPEMIAAGVAGVIGLRAGLWLTTSSETAYFIVFGLLPVWILVELLLVAGTVLCAYGIIAKRTVLFFGQPFERQLSIPLCLVGVVTIMIETMLWLYGLRAAA